MDAIGYTQLNADGTLTRWESGAIRTTGEQSAQRGSSLPSSPAAPATSTA